MSTITAQPFGHQAMVAPTEPIARTLLTRRSLRYALGVLWLLDGALQLQSFMFTSGFAHQIIAPAATGQPSFVAGPVRWNADLIGLHPAMCNAVFAGVQLALGLGFLIPRFYRRAIVASVVWAAGVWYLGEGLGGLASGHVTALVGAPGAALLYIVLALAAWPTNGRSEDDGPPRVAMALPSWIGRVWAALWIGFAVPNLVPGNSAASTIGGELTMNASMAPGWLAAFDRWIGSGVHAMGRGTGVLVVGVELAIGMAAWSQGRLRRPVIGLGIVLAAVFWAAGQSFGELFSGQATDPSTGPLLMLMGLATLGAAPKVSTSTVQAVASLEGQSLRTLHPEII
jgi:hypothetical protein